MLKFKGLNFVNQGQYFDTTLKKSMYYFCEILKRHLAQVTLNSYRLFTGLRSKAMQMRSELDVNGIVR